MGRRQQGEGRYLRLPHLRVVAVVSFQPHPPDPRVVAVVDDTGQIVQKVDTDVRMNRVLVKPRRRIFSVDGVIRGWRGGSTPTDMEYDATALKKLIGQRKAGNVYIGRAHSLTWTGDMFTYNNAMYPIPAAMQPIKEFAELEFGDVEHAQAGILQIGRIPTTLPSAVRCWCTAVTGVLARNSRETKEIHKALRTRTKWRTLAGRVLMRGRRAARAKIILEEREATRQRQVEEARQREMELQIAIAAANMNANRVRMETRRTTGSLTQLGEERSTAIVGEATASDVIPTRRNSKKSATHKAAKRRANKTEKKQLQAMHGEWSHWRPPCDKMIEPCTARSEGVLHKSLRDTQAEGQLAERHRTTRDQRRMDIEVQETNPTPASIRAHQQAWEIQLACWAGQLGHCGRKTTRARSVQVIQRSGG